MRPLQTQPFKKIISSASFKTNPQDLRQIFCIALQVFADTGACAGTFQIQICSVPCLGPFIDYKPADNQWTNLGSALTFAQASTASNQLISKIETCYVAMRIVFTDTSGGSNTSLVTGSVSGLGD